MKTIKSVHRKGVFTALDCLVMGNNLLKAKTCLRFLVKICLKIGAVMLLFILSFIFFCQAVKDVIHVHVCAVIGTRPNFPYTKYGGY